MSTPEPLVLAPAFEGLNRAFRLDAAALARLLALGVNPAALQPAYPVSTFLGALDVVAGTLESLGTPSTRYRLLGRAYVRGWVKTKTGLATVTVGRLLGPKRMLIRLQQTFRTSANYLETEAHARPPRALELLVKAGEAYVPRLPPEAGRLIDYRHGVLEGIIEQFGVNDSVDIVERDDARLLARYLVSW